MKCERCGKETNCFTTSMFSTETICMECKEHEKHDPRYEEACRVEREHVLAGDYNFKGIGWRGR